MREYIVFDLEWNQSSRGKEEVADQLPFEIFEIGAVKLNDKFEMTDQFCRLIRPQVYTKMHWMIQEVTHVEMEELQENGMDFVDASREFFEWCGPDAVFCTWGPMDLTELQRNMDFYQMENPFPKPLLFFDVQKLYGLASGDGKRISLDTAVEESKIAKERPFHRAMDDAWYTAQVMKTLDWERWSAFCSVDYHRLPEDRSEEIRMTFPGYFKYVSRVFSSKEDAMKDKTVTSMNCYACGRALRKKIRWFTANQKTYFALALCPEHGYLKGKIRMKKADKKSEEEQVFVIKTLKLTDEAGAELIAQRRDEMRKKRAKRNRAKKKKEKEFEQGIYRVSENATSVACAISTAYKNLGRQIQTLRKQGQVMEPAVETIMGRSAELRQKKGNSDENPDFLFCFSVSLFCFSIIYFGSF